MQVNGRVRVYDTPWSGVVSWPGEPRWLSARKGPLAKRGVASREGVSELAFGSLNGVEVMAADSSTLDNSQGGAGVNKQENGPTRETQPGSSGGAPRYSRRLSDKVLIAFHHACDQGDFEVAEQLLHTLEMMLTRRPLTPDGTRRRNMESLVAAHERLWYLRHPETQES